MKELESLGVFLLLLLIFTGPLTVPVNAVGPVIEQQINIIDQIYPTTSTSAAPGDGSLGYFYWDAAKYSGIGTQSAQLEIDAKTSITGAQIIGALYDDAGNILQRSKATVGNANTITTVNGCRECTNYNETFYSYMVLDGSGYPVISYVQNDSSSNGDLVLVHCGDANCTKDNVVTTVDGCASCTNNADIQKHQGLALDSNGYPMISYRTDTAGDLLFVHCGNANCSSGNTYTTVDGDSSSGGHVTDSVGSYVSMILDGNGYPVITYFNDTVDDLRFVHCGNANCSSGNTYVTLDGCASCNNTGSAGQYSSIRLDGTGYPVISYRVGAGDPTNVHDLELVHCGDANCSTGNTFAIVDNGTAVSDSAGLYTDLKLDSGGLPVIVFARGQFGTGDMFLKFAHCGNANCSSGNTVSILDGKGAGADCASTGNCDTGDVGWYNKLQFDTTANHYPIISYRSQVTGQLKVIHCNDANCAGGDESMVRVDGCTGCDEPNGTGQTSGAGSYDSLQLDSSGYPVIAYRKVGVTGTGNNDVKLVHCGNSDCNPTGSGQVDPVNMQTARSAWFTPSITGGASTRNLTLRVWVTGGTGTVQAARLKIVQSDTVKITDTKSAFELGDAQSVTGTTYGDLTNPKYFSYTASKFSAGTKTGYLEASLKGDGGQGQGRIYSSGFEVYNSTLTAGEEWTNIPAASASIDSTTKRSGSYSGRLNAPTASSWWGQDFNAGVAGDFFFRTYVYVAAMPASATTEIIVRTAKSANGGLAGFRLSDTGTLECLNVEDSVSLGSTSITTGTWYRLELELNIPSTGTGVSTVNCKVNGTSIASSTTENFAGYVVRYQLGTQSSNTGMDIYFDDVAINNSTGSWPGAGKIIHLLPNAAGDASAWSNDYASVDEVDPDDATSLVAARTTGDIDDHMLADSPIGATDIVNLVSVGVRFNGSAASANPSFKVRLKDAPSAVDIDYGSDITPADTTWVTNGSMNLPTLTAYDRPGSSVTPWTDAELDSAQLGYEMTSTSASNDAQVSTVWLLVDYTPTGESSGTTTYARVEECSDNGSGNLCSDAWSPTANGEVSVVSSNYQLARSATITLTNGKLYKVTVKRSAASGTENIANARFVVVQSDAGGITASQTVVQYINTLSSGTSTSYANRNYLNYHDPGNYSNGTFTYYFEADIKSSSGTGYAQLRNVTDGSDIASSEVSTASTTYVRVRSAAITPPSTAKNLDTQIKFTTTDVSNSWMIIEITGLGAAGPTKVVFTNTARTLTAGGCNGDANVLTIELQNAESTPTNPTGTTVIRVSSGSPDYTIYSDNTCITTVTSGDFTFTTAQNNKSVYIKDRRKSNPTWTLTSSKQSGPDTIADGTQVITINAGSVTRLVVTLPSQTFTDGTGNSGSVISQTAGSSFNITKISATDDYLNVNTGYSGAKTLGYAGPGNAPDTTPPSYTTGVSFTTGQSTTTLTTILYKAETPTITVTDGGLYGYASSTLTVDAGIINNYLVVVSTPQGAGVCFTGTNTITARDQWNNTRVQDVSTVNMTTNGTSIGFYTNANCTGSTTQYTLASGQSPMYIKTSVAQAGFTITATRNGFTETGTSGSITVTIATKVEIRGGVKIQGGTLLGL